MVWVISNLNWQFKNVEVRGMLEQKFYQFVHIMFLFVARMIDHATGIIWAHLKQLYTQSTQAQCSIRLGVEMKQKVQKNFKVISRYNNSESGFETQRWSQIANPEVLHLGSNSGSRDRICGNRWNQNNWSALPLGQWFVHIKSGYRNKSQR